MLVKIKKNTYLNIKNVAYIQIDEKDFRYTTMSNDDLNDSNFEILSREELIALFEKESQFIRISEEHVITCLNVKSIAKIDYSEEEAKIKVWFINDENPYKISAVNEGFLDKLIELVNEKLGK